MNEHDVEKLRAKAWGATVQAVLICRERRGGRVAVSEGEFVESHGLSGDAHAGPGDRQVPLFCEDGRARLKSGPADGFCFARFEETLRLSGIDTGALNTGDRLMGREVTLEVSPERKRCFPECPIVARGARCALAEGVRFARVIQGGSLRTGETLTVVPVNEKGHPGS